MILFDDHQSSAQAPSSLFFKNPLNGWKIFQAQEIESCLGAIENERAQGRVVVALFSYELGELLQHVGSQTAPTPSWPLIEAYSFANGERLSAEQADQWINDQLRKLAPQEQTAGLINLQANLTQEQYMHDIAEIQRYITQGDSYQINHTFRIKGQIFGHPLALYAKLRARQPVRYGAYIQTDARTVLCFSPELFIRNENGLMTAKPMKGTLASMQGDAQDLANNSKDRAENLMITDLIRNDLGRICTTGSIAVPKLFEVEQIGSVYQMTSTITGQLRQGQGLTEILQACFPCGSVTGAPKKRSMEIIRALEQAPRSLYCGSIACLKPDGDFQMNVAIRTLEIDSQGSCEMGIGSGITIGSNSELEWQECQDKAAFVMRLPSSVGLIETMRCEHGQITFLARHLDRMQHSAQALRIAFDRTAIEQEVASLLQDMQQSVLNGPSLVRLELSPDGALQIRHQRIDPITGAQKIFWAKDLIGEQACIMKSTNVLLAHKVSSRALYDAAWQRAAAKGGFDALFTNERGEVTEGGRSNLFALLDGTWITPALHCGVLPGVMRASLLSDWAAKQSVLYPEDLRRAQRIVVVSALRGIIEASLNTP